jgi:hypothetical protein
MIKDVEGFKRLIDKGYIEIIPYTKKADDEKGLGL